MSSKHTASMGLVVGGKLKLKGDKDKRRKKRDMAGMPEADDADADAKGEAEADAAALEYSADPVAGAGKLTTSGVVVMGQDTDFVKELSVGDTILVTVVDRFRGSSTNESRRVNMVLGRSARRPARRAARRPRRAQVCAPRAQRRSTWRRPSAAT